LQAAPDFREQLHRVNDYLLQHFIHGPDHRSRLILDLDSTVVTVFGHQEGVAVGYNPRYRGKRSYDPLLCLEANSSFLWDVELRRRDAGNWAGSEELLACCFHATPADIREVRVRADAGFGYGPVLEMLEARPAQYAVVA
jgi:Transposase DDE domain group 1